MNYKVSKHIDLKQQASWCPGCGHGIICRIITDAADKLGVGDRIVTVDDVACGQFGQYAMDYNSIMGAHGRVIATAAGVKRARPDALLIARPGDGSAYSIGIESTISCAMRNENILALVINNSVFGMTGGQMSPTSLMGMKTSTSPFGRTAERNGSMVDIAKLLGQADIAYLARCSVDSVPNIMKTQKAIEKALTKQMNGEGFCLIEVLSPCPTNWKLSPEKSMEFIRTTQSKALPLGEFVDKGGNK